MEKRIIVLGGIGRNERENRDNMRVLNGGQCLCTEIPHRQGTAACRQKKKTAGSLNKHQWGVVYFSSGVSATLQARDYKYPVTVIKRWKRKS